MFVVKKTTATKYTILFISIMLYFTFLSNTINIALLLKYSPHYPRAAISFKNMLWKVLKCIPNMLIFFFYIVVMMTTFQMTLLSNYVIPKQVLNTYNTYWSIILPCIFAPFSVFLLPQFIRYIPDEFLETVYFESSSIIDIIRIAIVPNVKSEIIVLAVLNFAEIGIWWNSR